MVARLHKVPRADHGEDDPNFVLLHVEPAGGKTLDLNLIGTENDNVFNLSLKHSQTAKLKDKKVTLEEWEPIISAFLLGTDPEGNPIDAPEGVEAVASIQGPKDVPKSITIVIQRNIEGITQKLGTIVLPRDPEGDGDLYDWCSESILANEKLTQQLQASKAKVHDKEAQIRKLEASLAELVKAKNDNDTQLLEKFSLLLNEKKLKIREQQRLLHSSDIDPAQLKELDEARTRSRSRSAGPSRKGKRKAHQVEEEEDSKDSIDKMDVDDDAAADNSDQESARDSDEETADDKTASEASEDDEPIVPPPKRKAAVSKQEPSSSQASSSRTLRYQAEPPQKRELPFARKPPAKPTVPAADDGSATESDDEL